MWWYKLSSEIGKKAEIWLTIVWDIWFKGKDVLRDIQRRAQSIQGPKKTQESEENVAL